MEVKSLLKDATAAGPGSPQTLNPNDSNRGITVSIGGIAGAVAAVVQFQVSNDTGLTWATRLEFSLSGTSTLILPVTDADTDPNGPFPLVRGNVVSMTAGAKVGMDVCAAASGRGLA